MAEKLLNNNQAVVEGEIVSDFEFSHEVFGEGFYYVKLKVSRLSQSNDTIPLLMSERLIDVNQSYIGQFMEARGQFRSFNKHEGTKNHLILSLFVREFTFLDQLDNLKPNVIFLDGYICKEPVYRTTPFGREITDMLVAVNRAYSKSDYIPCICWGRNARYAKHLPVGGRIQLWGRIQSREYQKRLSDFDVRSFVAYEVSVNQMEYCSDPGEIRAQYVADSRDYVSVD